MLSENPDVSALIGIGMRGITLARRDFLETFTTGTGDYLKTGRVLGTDSKPVPEFVSVVSDSPLLIRGGPQSRSNTCPSCGRLRYVPANEPYILKDSLKGRPIYISEGYSGLILVPELRHLIDRKRWKGIFVTKLSVLDEPLDGIEDFPENWF
jgi:hypothetical protein